MRKHVHLIAIAAICLWASASHAQEAKIRKAEDAVKLLRYKEAIQLYEEVLAKKEDLQVRLSLALAYRKLQDYERAASTFSKIKDWSNISADYMLQYGCVLVRSESCGDAQTWFNAYLERNPHDSRAPMFRNACAAMQQLMTCNEGLYEVFLLPFNSPQSEMAPMIYGDNLVFASDRNAEQGAFLDLFVANRIDSSAEAQVFASELNTRLHEATAFFNKSGDQIFFTRSRTGSKYVTDSRIVPLEIMTAGLNSSKQWADVQPIPLTDPAYSAAHPFLSANERRLYFSSDMPGGFGGKDLYYSEKTSMGWGPPINLGPEINTRGDEIFPFIGPDNRLYFSSDGHPSLGGQDIMVSTLQPNGNWTNGENLGTPFNSTYDDFSFIMAPDGLSGYFASSRPGGPGRDDIYGFKLLYRQLSLAFQNSVTGEAVEGATLKTRCDMLPNSSLRVPVYACCNITVSAPGYDDTAVEICGDDAQVDYSRPYPIALQPERKYTLRGTTTDGYTGAPLSNAVVLVFEAGNYFNSVVSGSDGAFMCELPKNKCFTFKVEKGDYFARSMPDTICTTGKTYEFSLQSALQPFRVNASRISSGPAKGVFVPGIPTGDDREAPFVLQIYYDLHSTRFRDDNLPEMQRLQRLLQDNPNISVEISSHTDTRGEPDFNLRLSQKRAELVVEWLIGKGIDGRRLTAKGYGETRPVNHCLDGVTCPESDHQLNRRTEFRVLGSR